MFLLDGPYISTLLIESVNRLELPVLDNPAAREALGADHPLLTDDAAFARLARQGRRLYANSENAIGWVAEHLPGAGWPEKISLFKDKTAFREFTRSLHPDLFFQGLPTAALSSFDPAPLPKPFIIKPAVGFFSLGVHRVNSLADWPRVREAMTRALGDGGGGSARGEADPAEAHASVTGLYPSEVLDPDRLIIEAVIPGEEFAVDVFFKRDNTPIILNILGHLFATPDHVNDRVYFTSAELMERWLTPFSDYLGQLGRLADLRDFPAHVELRVDGQGVIRPIEVNPLRFGGWCAADLAMHAYGVDPYACFLNDQPPDWPAILAARGDRIWSLVVADLPAGLDRDQIASVDYGAFWDHFSHPLELREVDYRAYPLFAMLFAETRRGEEAELEAILKSDLMEFLRLRPPEPGVNRTQAAPTQEGPTAPWHSKAAPIKRSPPF